MTMRYLGTSGANFVFGTASSDHMDGGLGSDLLNGGAGSDVLIGGRGDDTLVGGADADRLFGGEGADVLTGGTGSDTMTGGNGPDLYAFNRGDALQGDHIWGFGADDTLRVMGNSPKTAFWTVDAQGNDVLHLGSLGGGGPNEETITFHGGTHPTAGQFVWA
jgi:Ca2+-binding RTX toxin-like protein